MNYQIVNTRQKLPNKPHIKIFTMAPRLILINANSPYIHKVFTEISKKKKKKKIALKSLYRSQNTFSILMTIYYNILSKKYKRTVKPRNLCKQYHKLALIPYLCSTLIERETLTHFSVLLSS